MTDRLATATYIPELVSCFGLSAYGLYLSAHNIKRLLAYEKQSKKAAQWSTSAAHRLSKTRTTQASGVVTLFLSLATCTTLLSRPFSHHAAAATTTSPTLLLSAALANTVLLYAAHAHMARFWNDATQIRIPFVEGFNEAVRGSEKVVWLLETLWMGWAGMVLVWLGIWFGMWGEGVRIAIWGLGVGWRGWRWREA